LKEKKTPFGIFGTFGGTSGTIKIKKNKGWKPNKQKRNDGEGMIMMEKE
jgi:hypothetical protein